MSRRTIKRVLPMIFVIILLFDHDGFGQRQMKGRGPGDINQGNSDTRNGGSRIDTELRVDEPLSVQLNWLDRTAPPVDSGVSFGVPWPRGVFKKEQAFTLK